MGGAANQQRVRLKVCCIASVAEARLAISAGADAVGLIRTSGSLDAAKLSALVSAMHS